MSLHAFIHAGIMLIFVALVLRAITWSNENHDNNNKIVDILADNV